MRKTILLVAIPTVLLYVGIAATFVVALQQPGTMVTIFLRVLMPLLAIVMLLFGKPWQIFQTADQMNYLGLWVITKGCGILAMIITGLVLLVVNAIVTQRIDNPAVWSYLVTAVGVFIVDILLESFTANIAHTEWSQQLYTLRK